MVTSRCLAGLLKMVCDGLLLTGAFALACVIRFEGVAPRHLAVSLAAALPLAVGLQLACLCAAGVGRATWGYTSLADVQRLAVALAVAGILLIVCRQAAAVLRQPLAVEPLISLGVVLLDVPLSFLGLAGVRAACRRRRERAEQHRERRPASPSRPTVLIGAGHAGALVAREILAHPELGLEPVGFLDDNPGLLGMKISGLSVLGSIDQVGAVAAQHGAREALITIASSTGAALQRIVRLCQENGLPVKIIPPLHEIVAGRGALAGIRDVAIEDLLQRAPVQLDRRGISDTIRGRRVLVTGAGGSIGSELCREVCRFGPALLILVEQAENSLFQVHRELAESFPAIGLIPCIADICDEARMRQILAALRPALLLHAAAHKHVPLMEWNPGEAIKNNVLGTSRLARLADACGVRHFVMISTDKAVRPASIMGASKRVAELFVQTLSQRSRTRFVVVRFGNVLGSNGSVVPLFKEQIARGEAVTVTHPEMRRFFMTIPEACQLTLQAASMGKGGEIFILDMGEPIKIVDLARNLIRLCGLTPDKDVPIRFIGIRPGEKLSEELFLQEERTLQTSHPRIFVGQLQAAEWSTINRQVRELGAQADGPIADIHAKLKEIVPEYQYVLTGPASPEDLLRPHLQTCGADVLEDGEDFAAGDTLAQVQVVPPVLPISALGGTP